MKNLSVEIDGKVINRTCENCFHGDYDIEGFYCEMWEKEVRRPDTELCKCHILKEELLRYEEL